MTTYYLLRHGEHAVQGQIAAGRAPGIPLSERGRREAAWAAERLADAKIAAIYASPLERAQETAHVIGDRLDLPVTVRPDLSELDFGEWTGLTFDAIRQDPRWQVWAAHRSIACLPGGETMREVQRRVVEAMMELREAHRTEASSWSATAMCAGGADVRAGHADRFLRADRGGHRIGQHVADRRHGIRVINLNDRKG